MTGEMSVQVKRIYNAGDESDGFRVLIDRLWPRGLSKQDARYDLWAKDVAPSTDLRKWFSHDPSRFDAFRKRYLDELSQRQEAVDALLREAGDQPITLLTAARDPQCSHAAVLAECLNARRRDG